MPTSLFVAHVALHADLAAATLLATQVALDHVAAMPGALAAVGPTRSAMGGLAALPALATRATSLHGRSGDGVLAAALAALALTAPTGLVDDRLRLVTVGLGQVAMARLARTSGLPTGSDALRALAMAPPRTAMVRPAMGRSTTLRVMAVPALAGPCRLARGARTGLVLHATRARRLASASLCRPRTRLGGVATTLLPGPALSSFCCHVDLVLARAPRLRCCAGRKLSRRGALRQPFRRRSSPSPLTYTNLRRRRPAAGLAHSLQVVH